MERHFLAWFNVVLDGQSDVAGIWTFDTQLVNRSEGGPAPASVRRASVVAVQAAGPQFERIYRDPARVVPAD